MNIRRRLERLEVIALPTAMQDSQIYSFQYLSNEELDLLIELTVKAGPDDDLSLLTVEELRTMRSLLEKALPGPLGPAPALQSQSQSE